MKQNIVAGTRVWHRPNHRRGTVVEVLGPVMYRVRWDDTGVESDWHHNLIRPLSPLEALAEAAK